MDAKYDPYDGFDPTSMQTAGGCGCASGVTWDFETQTWVKQKQVSPSNNADCAQIEAQLTSVKSQLDEKSTALAKKDVALSEKDKQIAELEAKLKANNAETPCDVLKSRLAAVMSIGNETVFYAVKDVGECTGFDTVEVVSLGNKPITVEPKNRL